MGRLVGARILILIALFSSTPFLGFFVKNLRQPEGSTFNSATTPLQNSEAKLGLVGITEENDRRDSSVEELREEVKLRVLDIDSEDSKFLQDLLDSLSEKVTSISPLRRPSKGERHCGEKLIPKGDLLSTLQNDMSLQDTEGTETVDLATLQPLLIALDEQIPVPRYGVELPVRLKLELLHAIQHRRAFIRGMQAKPGIQLRDGSEVKETSEYKCPEVRLQVSISSAQIPPETDSPSQLRLLGMSSFTLIAACKDCHVSLGEALHSWSQVAGLRRIIVVDWGSSPPYSSCWSNLPRSSPVELLIIRVEPDSRGSGPPALASNVWKAVSPLSDYVIKVSCDVVLDPSFLTYHFPLMRSNEFWVSLWTPSADLLDPRGRPVILLCHSSLLLAVGGYDERMEWVGWEESDLFIRLQAQGAQPRQLEQGTYSKSVQKAMGRVTSAVPRYHIQGQLMSSRDVPTKIPDDLYYNTVLNRLLRARLQPWSSAHSPTQLVLEELYPVDLHPRSRMFVAKVTGEGVPSYVALTRPSRLAALRALALKVTLAGYGVPWSTLDSLPESYLRDMVFSYSSGRKILIVNVQHGLANRLRALAAAFVVANSTGRHLRVVWEKNHHCNASFSELFQNSDLDVWNKIDEVEVSRCNFLRINYMDPTMNSTSRDYVNTTQPLHIYIRSAYRLTHESVLDKPMSVFLKTLIPSDETQRIIAMLNLPSSYIGVHIRHQNPKSEIRDLPTSEYTDNMWATLSHCRQVTNAKVFGDEMEKILASREQAPKFFVSADDSNTTQVLVDRFGDRISFIPNQRCFDRTQRCLHYAIADIWLLSRAEMLLGSFWSSFSEIAGILGNLKPKYAGWDFPVKENDSKEGKIPNKGCRKDLIYPTG